MEMDKFEQVADLVVGILPFTNGQCICCGENEGRGAEHIQMLTGLYKRLEIRIPSGFSGHYPENTCHQPMDMVFPLLKAIGIKAPGKAATVDGYWQDDYSMLRRVEMPTFVLEGVVTAETSLEKIARLRNAFLRRGMVLQVILKFE